MSVTPFLPAAGVAAAAAFGRRAAAAVTDGLSFAAELLRPSETPEAPAAVVPSPKPEQFQESVRQFALKLRERLAAVGASAPQAIELVGDGLGGVQVSGDHPERALIEQAINGDPALLAEFQKLADQCRQLAPTTSQRDRRDFGLVVAGDDVQAFLT